MAKALFALICASSFSLFAELTEVRDSYRISVSASGDGVVAKTPKLANWPTDLPTPIFWFDCTVTNGWEITLGEDGTNYVTKIPSLVGDGRFLTTDTTLEGTTFSGWGTVKPKPPMLVKYGDLPGGPVLDFGKWGSRRGMMFSPFAEEGAASSNLLSKIGSMVALWGSQEGGGYLFAGGNPTSGDKENYRWVRGWDNYLSDAGGTVYYWSTVLGGHRGTIAKTPGFYMHDGVPASVELAAMNGGWEILGLSADEAKWFATGLGLGDIRNGMHSRSGGSRIGEMIVFGETLTQDQMKRAQIFLREKWLGRGIRGWNGDAHLGSLRTMPDGKVAAQIHVPDDETLTVQSLAGGRGARVVKNGEGMLRLNGAAEYAAPVEIRGGGIEVTRKKAPASAEELPFGLYMRFDASQADSIVTSTENGTNFVERMNNLASGTYQKKNIFLSTYRNTHGDLRPWLIASPLGSDRPIVDFGVRITGAKGRYFVFWADNGDGSRTRIEPNSCGTLVALVCAERGGGHICNGPFSRGSRWVDSYNEGLVYNATFGDAKIANTDEESRIFINGQRISKDSGFPHRGCHVIAYQVQPGVFTALAAEQYYTDQEASASGGVMFGEILFWNRPLDDDELMDIQAYLSKKWLGVDMPGYSGVSEGAADIQEVSANAPSTIEVGEGNVVKIAKLTAKAKTEKTGSGTLAIGIGSDTSGLIVREGHVIVTNAFAEVGELCQLAAGAAFHLDASLVDSMMFEEENGTNFVKSWYSPNGIAARQTTATRQPWLAADESSLLNGKPVVDFGIYGKSSSVNTESGARYLEFDVSFDSVRSVFIVRGSHEGGGMLLGDSSSIGTSDWTRHGGMEGTLDRPIIGSPTAAVSSGEFYLDGVRANCSEALPTGGYELIDVHPAAATHVGALARYKNAYMYGGQRIAELIIYQRVLSEREKVATRNYLTRKWFPERELQDLPEEETIDDTIVLSKIDTGDSLVCEVKDNLVVSSIVGSGRVVKSDATEFSVKDISEFAGEIEVQEGTLAVTGTRPFGEIGLVSEGRILHLDAADGICTLTNANSTVSVTNWVSLAGNGWTAVPGPSYWSKDMHYPTCLEYELNGNAVVKMTYHGWALGEEYFLFHKDGVQSRLEGIKSAFWVIGSQEGGGFLLGGGGSDRMGWHRGGDGAGSKAADGLLNTHAQNEVEEASWRINRTDVSKSTGLSGGYDLVSMVMKETAVNAASADGLAFDGRILTPEDYRNRTGHQRLGELILYDRVLSVEERRKVEDYLAAKWFDGQLSPVNSATVTIAEDATLRTSGEQYVDTLAGCGNVDGDITVRVFRKNEVTDGALTISGKLTLARNPVIDFSRLSVQDVAGKLVAIASAGEFGASENLEDVQLVGVPDGLKARALISKGLLAVRVSSGKGLTMVVR